MRAGYLPDKNGFVGEIKHEGLGLVQCFKAQQKTTGTKIVEKVQLVEIVLGLNQ
jgi:hypothetical protein